MRGKPRRSAWWNRRPRIIPAHAGQTRYRFPVVSWMSDHPRACGANDGVWHKPVRQSGSSPRMRGKLPCWDGDVVRIRIIPAHAGQTGVSLDFHGNGADHPRACGANYPYPVRRSPACGSSPRMRGKRGTAVGEALTSRIIPAHAGQTVEFVIHVEPDADHPRACGANSADNRFMCY